MLSYAKPHKSQLTLLVTLFIGLILFGYVLASLHAKRSHTVNTGQSSTAQLGVMEGQGEVKAQLSESVSPISDTGEPIIADDQREVLFGLEAYPDHEIISILEKNINRIMAFDQTFTAGEILKFEHQMALSANTSEVAAKILQDQLGLAFSKFEPQKIYFLERVLGSGKKPVKYLIEAYFSALETQAYEIQDYALQGLYNLKPALNVRVKHKALEVAFSQIELFSSTDKMLSAVTAISELGDGAEISPLYKELGLRLLEDAHETSTTAEQQFYVQKALYKLTDSTRSEQLANSFLTQQPTKATVLAVLESLSTGRIDSGEELLANIKVALNRSDVSQEEIELANELELLEDGNIALAINN